MKTIALVPATSLYPVTTKITLSDLRSRWGKFDEAELAAIEYRQDFVAQIQTKYGWTAERANSSVDAWADGRVF
jgi:uncharacterized protein YjbJ (UPF0337 family)